MIDGINIRQDISVKVLQAQEFSVYDEPNTDAPHVFAISSSEFLYLVKTLCSKG